MPTPQGALERIFLPYAEGVVVHHRMRAVTQPQLRRQVSPLSAERRTLQTLGTFPPIYALRSLAYP